MFELNVDIKLSFAKDGAHFPLFSYKERRWLANMIMELRYFPMNEPRYTDSGILWGLISFCNFRFSSNGMPLPHVQLQLLFSESLSNFSSRSRLADSLAKVVLLWRVCAAPVRELARPTA